MKILLGLQYDMKKSVGQQLDDAPKLILLYHLCIIFHLEWAER